MYSNSTNSMVLDSNCTQTLTNVIGYDHLIYALYLWLFISSCVDSYSAYECLHTVYLCLTIDFCFSIKKKMIIHSDVS